MSFFAAFILAISPGPVPAAPPPDESRRGIAAGTASKPATTGKARPARALGNLASLIGDGDYPAAALQAGEQGVVHFRLEVGQNGRVTNCTITTSSGSAALDAWTCRIMTTRARFEPARNAAGKAVADTVTSRIGWKIG